MGDKSTISESTTQFLFLVDFYKIAPIFKQKVLLNAFLHGEKEHLEQVGSFFKIYGNISHPNLRSRR